MPAVIDPVSGLELYELSHRWGMYTPIFPGYEEIKLERITHHAKQGVMTHKITTIFHTSTHLNAPIHLVPGAPAVGDLELQKFFGTGVVLSFPKRKWGLIEPSDLERAKPAIKAGDIVLINTGWHRKYADSKEYFGYAPGLSKHAADWLVKKRVKLVGIDTACIDHPLATSLGPHRNGPQIKYLLPEYKEATGREAIKDFPEWNAAHRTLLEAGIPTIENVGGDIDALGGKRCTFQGFPWKWHEGDACVIRLVAMLDPKGTCRLERGAGRKVAAAKKSPAIKKSSRGADSLQFFDLSHPWGHGMPQWPSRANLNVRVLEFHAKDGLLVQQFEGIMHRGTHMDAPIHVAENTPTLTGYPLWRFFGTGVVVSIPKGKWGVVTPKDLERAEPKIQKNDIVMINTGSHKNHGDNPDYFAYSPGLYKEAAEWLVERGVKLVGIDVQALDHPLGTFLGPHGPGPAQPHLDVEYKAETGHHIIEDFPYWEPAHKIMMTNGIPGIENIGGDIDQITGRRCTFFAFPWRWPEGEGCALRVVAVLDPKQAFRFETG
ncbi:MAG TPA: cyclase family protein [Xanthobacteraceae bacterium]|nr:cyclase family protein [Xanthobacteraceae bacterium]